MYSDANTPGHLSTGPIVKG